MAIVPSGQKFHTVPSTVVTTNLGSALANSQREIFTMEDIVDTVNTFVGLGGTQYVFVAAKGTDLENAAELQAAYVTAQGMSPSATNRITVIAAPGNYNFDSANFEMGTEYIDLVSLDGNRSIVFNGLNSIEILASNVFVRGVDVGTSAFVIANELDYLRIENCQGGDYSFGGGSTIASSSTFTDCTGGNYSFGGDGGKANGIFTNCIGGDLSFGGGNQANGIFTDCIGEYASFGGNGTASGVFNSCIGSTESFGGNGGTADGTFTNCTANGNKTFGGAGGTASGIFNNCTANGKASFGASGTASGTFTDCSGIDGAFGGDGGTADGVFNRCTGRDGAFGGAGGTASGTFTDCSSGNGSFGGDGGNASGVFNSCIGGSDSFGGESSGTLDGFLYYCRLTSGKFATVSGGGRTVLCIDGYNDQNNQ